MEEAARTAVPVESDDEHRLIVAEREERVERHHEPALGLLAAPLVGDRREAVAQCRVELARAQHSRLEARARQPVHGLAHLPDRAPLERERRRLDDRLVAVVERMQAVLTIDADAPRDVYGYDLILVRPDLHIVWRGNREPSDPARLARLATGHA